MVTFTVSAYVYTHVFTYICVFLYVDVLFYVYCFKNIYEYVHMAISENSGVSQAGCMGFGGMIRGMFRRYGSGYDSPYLFYRLST